MSVHTDKAGGDLAPAAAGPDRPSGGVLRKRIISAAILIPVALGVVLSGGTVLALFVAAAVLILLREWAGIIKVPARAPEILLAAAGGLASVAATALGETRLALGIGLAAALGAGLIGMVWRRNGFWTLIGALYIQGPAIAFLWLRGLPSGLDWTIWLFAVVWTTDTGAYGAGRLIGGPAFAPFSSPNKTWSGLIGGVVLAVIVGTLAAHLVFAPLPDSLRVTAWFATLALLVSLVTQTGDIFESGLKRHFGVKDSGRLIPGHGGLLDRLDGFLFAVMMLSLTVALGIW